MTLADGFQAVGFALFIAGVFLIGGTAPALLCAGAVLFVAGGLAAGGRR